MIRLSVLFVVACAVQGFAGTVPSEYLEGNERVVGGWSASSGQFPYQVSLRTAANRHFCGGTIINNRYALTAAHCTVSQMPVNTRVVVGSHLLSSGGVSHNVIRIVIHEFYNANTLANDISLVQTTSTITMNNLVQTVGLGLNFINTGSGALVSGWGQLASNAGVPDNLQWMVTDIITLDDCRARHWANAARILDSTICTLSPYGQGMCMGDSGGPLIHGGLLHGIVAWGIPCGLGSPDVHTRVSSYWSWIYTNAV
ncbi:chymotrypsin-2-like [Sabethes cyaneus]|uniref:chymotrypsin-2-like n=1 Tax=Sabethes cyaneus TaxID=53552 RepID=UPI00237D46E0|nr:chymotrypsin-2-like [Sabethes cyaneus]